jgi:hypothetical protein
MSAEQFYASYEARGFRFRTSILTRYALSLHTKPFVILSGVSGTGKTKIAQLFQPPPPPPHALLSPKVVAQPDRQRLIFTATSGMRTGDGRGNLPNQHMPVVFEPSDLAEIERRSAELLAGGAADNVIDPVLIEVATPDGQELKFGIYVQRPQSPLVRLRAKSKRGDVHEYDSQHYLRSHYQDGEAVELEKLAPYRFRIVPPAPDRIHEVAATAEVEQRATLSPGENLLFIPVQSNWTDRTELFGFYNQLEGLYSCTPLLRFIQQAAEHPAIPHFLILDEMNLSKVEHYFSDFLSCLESRIAEGDGLHQEAIHLHGRGDFAPADDPLVEQVPSRLFLPPNLYVTGTVNVDETTYMFSPKVLDRANVIEFNDVDLGLLEGPVSALNDGFVLSSFPPFEGASPASVQDYLDAPASTRTMLKALLAILKPHSMHFGYRVAQEICRFVNAARAHVGDDEGTLTAALDAQIVQKILPKFHGSQAQLEEPLRVVLAKLLEGAPGFDGTKPDQMDAAWLQENAAVLDAAEFPLSVDKLRRMLSDLYIRGFASFIS